MINSFVRNNFILIFSACFLGIFSVACAFLFWKNEKGVIRREATNYVRILPNEDIPGLIDDQREAGLFWAIREQAVNQALNPALVNAWQFLSDSLNMPVNKDLVTRESETPKLEPLLANDGQTAPRLLASIPASQGEILDEYGQPLRWRVPANIMGAFSRLKPRQPEEKLKPLARIPSLPRLAPSMRAGFYRGMVENFSRRYNLDPDLVMAIIHTESDFSPTLVSNKSAMGLMQLLPSTASDEVHRFLYGKRGAVSYEDLAVPETNIKYGTAYLHILKSRYFQAIYNPRIQEYCVIASYNMGPNRFLRLYGSNNAQASAKINSMTPDEFYNDLFGRLPSRETRFFVEKVRRMKQHYAGAAQARN